MRKAVTEFGRGKKVTDESWPKFANQLFYVQHDINDNADADNLRLQVEKIEQDWASAAAGWLISPPRPSCSFPPSSHWRRPTMVPPTEQRDKLRVVVEKPFGQDLESSLELNKALRRILHESQIYRIDHYLGKETVQNILLFRFGNAIFEPLFNRNHIDHDRDHDRRVAGDRRGPRRLLRPVGRALRDVLQNHVLQLLCLIAMEPPALFEAEYIRNEKLKVLQALAPGAAADRSRMGGRRAVRRRRHQRQAGQGVP